MTDSSAEPDDDDLAAMLRAFAAGDLATALAAARRAERHTDHPVAAAAARYLAHVAVDGARPTYEAADAFSAFIRGGGNQRLYRAVGDALRAIYRGVPSPIRVADIGVGDGLALRSVLDAAALELTLIEPAAALLASTTALLDRHGARYTAFPMTAEGFAHAHPDARFDLIQATFALQSLTPAARHDVLAWTRRATGRLVLAEFDVPRFDGALDPAHLAYVLARYRRGLGEYADDGGLVAQGFLMPVMFGYFATGRERTNYEQPMAAWVDDVRAAGFTEVTARPVDDYWWAPGFVLEAG